MITNNSFEKLKNIFQDYSSLETKIIGEKIYLIGLAKVDLALSISTKRKIEELEKELSRKKEEIKLLVESVRLLGQRG